MSRDLHVNKPEECHDVVDGTDSWWDDYHMEESRISLADRLQNKWFLSAMDTMNHHKDSLSKYDRELFQKLSDGYNLVKDSMTITRKQMNHIKQVAMELEASDYNGR